MAPAAPQPPQLLHCAAWLRHRAELRCALARQCIGARQQFQGVGRRARSARKLRGTQKRPGSQRVFFPNCAAISATFI